MSRGYFLSSGVRLLMEYGRIIKDVRMDVFYDAKWLDIPCV